METILEKVTLSEPEAKIRVYEVMNHKIHKEYQGNEPIDRIQDYVVLYAEVANIFFWLKKKTFQINFIDIYIYIYFVFKYRRYLKKSLK